MRETGASRPAELTIRAIVTGMIIGALLTPCNVYSGLKIGWTFNMSVAAGLIGFAFWSLSQRAAGTPGFGLLENNLSQTASSSAASIISAGLAAPIPALALLTGQTLSYPVLAVWLFVVSILGVLVAATLRRQLLERENLPFPPGVVTAETMREIHEGGREATQRLKVLGLAGALSAALKAATSVFSWAPAAPGFSISLAKAGGGSLSVTAKNLGFALDPSLLMVGFGAISGLRIALSLMLGAVLGWAILAPIALGAGWAQPGEAEAGAVWFGPLVEWLLWPGATLMTVSSLVSFGLSASKSVKRPSLSRLSLRGENGGLRLGSRRFWAAFGAIAALCTAAQSLIFGIGPVEGVLAVGLSFVLAIVAARVSGETAITPIGALGKITQFSFGAIAPGNVTNNLMSANVTGGAAGQCADLMHDFKTGQLIGATPGHQITAQLFGVLTGSLVASIAYLTLIPDPVGMLLTADWPAPAVATWKAVAEVLSAGMAALPQAAGEGIAIAALFGVLLGAIETRGPEAWRPYLPSAPAVGLGFVIPAWLAVSMLLGALGAVVLRRIAPQWAEKRIVVLAAGLIVGESLAGVIDALAAAFR